MTASQITYEGVARPSSIEAAVETGPCGLCGASATRCTSASAAIRRTSVSPPQCVMSGWTTLQAPFDEKVGERLRADEPLARGDRRRHRALDRGDVVRALGPAGLLEPVEAEGLERGREEVTHARARAGMAVDHDVDPLAGGIAHRRDARLGVADRSEPFERHRRGHRHRLEGGEALLDHRRRELAEALRLVALVEVLHLPAAEVAVEPDVVAYGAAPQLVAGHAVHLAEEVPERDVDPAHGRPAHDVVAVPEVLPEHHLPQVLDSRGILADDQLREVLDRSDDGARVPLERRLAPAVEAGLVRHDPDEDPVAHPCVADVRLDRRDLHVLLLTRSSSATLSSTSVAVPPWPTFVFVIPYAQRYRSWSRMSSSETSATRSRSASGAKYPA